MKTRIEIFGNIKKLALAAVVLLCVNVDGWGQAEHVDYTVKLSLNSIIQSYSGSGTPSSIYNVCVGFEAENYEGQTIWKNQYSSVGSYPYNYSYYCSSCSFELKTGRAANIKSIRAVILAIKVWNSYSSCCDCPTNNEILPYQDYTRAYIVYVDDRVYNGLTYPCTQTITVDYNDDSDTPVHSSGGGNSPIATTFSVDIIPQKPSIIKFVGANNISKPASDMGNYMVNDRGTGLQASYIDV
ncbi:MAG: hypothetical protein LBD59_09360, partial [Prevotellaceae bacterium]|nr:hypothetical protein [Prevotellaceae bacterium]